jgi:O-antigen/teichoic acid export membrane protein
MFDTLLRFLKHSTIYAVGNIINRAGAFLLLPVYTRFLTTGEYGILEIFVACSTVIRAFLSMGIGHATLRFYFEYESEDDRKTVVGTAFYTSLLVSLLVVIVLSGCSHELSHFIMGSEEYSKYFVVAFLILLFELSHEICFAYLRAKEYSTLYICATTFQLTFQIVANYLMVVKFHMGVLGVLIGNLSAVLATWLILAVVTIRFCRLKYKVAVLKTLLKYSYPFIISSVAAVVIGTSDRFFLKAYSTLSILGIYALAMRFGLIVRIVLVDAFATSFGSFRFSIMKDENANEIYSRILSYFTLCIVMLGLCISVFVEDILRIFADAMFWEASNVVPIIVLGIGFTGFTYVFQTGILISKRTKHIFYLSTASGIFILILNWALIPSLNMYGAAIAVVLTNVLLCFGTLFVSQRLYFIKYEIKRPFMILGAGIGMYYLITIVQPAEKIISIFIKAGMWLAFPVIIGLFGFYKKDEIERMGSIARGVFRKLSPENGRIP